MKIRIAVLEDAPQLLKLNSSFNGPGLTTAESVRQALAQGGSEVVVVAEVTGCLVGFVCLQIKKSFCYDENSAEITEVFVDEPYRRQGIARQMIQFAETYCAETHQTTTFTLLTGQDNLAAQALYRALSYKKTKEVMMEKNLTILA